MFQNLAYSEADFKTEARAILGEYNKNSAEPIRKLLEVQRDHSSRRTPTSTPRWGSSPTSRTCRTSTSTPRFLPALVPAAVHHPCRGRRHRPEQVLRWSRSTGEAGSPAAAPPWRSRKSRRRKGRLRARAVDERHAALRDGGVPVPLVRRHAQGFAGARPHRRALLRPHVRALQQAGRQRAEGGRAQRGRAGQRRRLAVHDLRAGEEPRRRGLRPGSNPGDDRQHPLRAGAGAARGGREVVQPLQLRTHARQHRADRVGGLGVRVLQTRLRYGQQLLPHARHADPRGSPGGEPPVLHRQRDDRDDALEGPAAGRHQERAGARVGQARAGLPRRGRGNAWGRDGLEARRGSGHRHPPGSAAIGAAAAEFQAALHRRLGQRSCRQGRPGRTDRGDGRGSRVARHDHRTDRGGPLPDGRIVQRARGQGDDDLHRRHPPRPLEPLHGHRPAAAARARVPRRGLHAAQGCAAERAGPGPAVEQRGGARQGAAADEHLPRHALWACRARHRRRHQGHHAGRGEAVRA